LEFISYILSVASSNDQIDDNAA